MRRRAVVAWVVVFSSLVVAIPLTTRAQNGPPAQERRGITWADVAARAQFYPPVCKLTAPIEQRDGTKFDVGTEVCVQHVNAANAVVYTIPDAVSLTISPAQCDLLAAATKYLSSLTPEQRALQVESLWRDPTLTPGVVTLRCNVQGPATHANPKGETIPAGSTVTIGEFNNYGVRFNSPTDNREVLTGYVLTDIYDRARAARAVPKNRRPGRINEAIAGRTVDADGKALDMKPAAFFVLAYLSSADARSQTFLSKLAETYKSTLADRKDVAVVTVSTDKTSAEALAFAKDKALAWATLPPDRVPLLIGGLNPSNRPTAIVVCDRFGSIGFSNLSGKFANETPESVLGRFVATLKPGAAPLDLPDVATKTGPNATSAPPAPAPSAAATESKPAPPAPAAPPALTAQASPTTAPAKASIDASAIKINKMPIQLDHRTFNPKRPPAEMPPLQPPEEAQCCSDFLSNASVAATAQQTDATHALATVNKIEVTLNLNMVIWVPDGVEQATIDHEEGHRQISERFYAHAEDIARKIAERYIGRQVPITGSNLRGSLSQAIGKMGEEITNEFNRQMPVETTQARYDAITDHHLKNIPVPQAIEQAFADTVGAKGPLPQP